MTNAKKIHFMNTMRRTHTKGWQGDLCDVPICKRGCHPLNGFCKRPFECRCKLGFYGENCEHCIPLPGCQNGICHNPFECQCAKGWRGVFCNERMSFISELNRIRAVYFPL